MRESWRSWSPNGLIWRADRRGLKLDCRNACENGSDRIPTSISFAAAGAGQNRATERRVIPTVYMSRSWSPSSSSRFDQIYLLTRRVAPMAARSYTAKTIVCRPRA